MCRRATTTPATVSLARRGSTSAGPAPVPTPEVDVVELYAECRPRRPARPALRDRNRASPTESGTAPAVAATTSSTTSDGRHVTSDGTATSVASAPVNFSASSAMSRNTVAGSAPDNISVAMSRVASIHDCRARDCS